MRGLPGRSAAWGALLGLVCACGPKIHELSVEPRRVCPGDTVRITFKTRGRPHLLTVRRGGSAVDTTTYTIVAEARGETAHSAMDVLTFTPAAVPVLAFDTEMLGTDSLVAAGSTSATVWPDQVRLGDVFADSGRALVVSHGGREGVVPAGDAGSPAWRGLPVSGEWEFRSGLLPGEVPGDPDQSPPAHLYLKVLLTCDHDGAQP